MLKKIILLFSFPLLLNALVLAQTPGSPDALITKAGVFQIAELPNRLLLRKDIVSWPEFNGMYYGVVSFERMPSRTDRREMKAAGIHVLDFLPGQFFILSISKNATLNALNALGLTHAAPFKPEFTLLINPAEVPSRAVELDEGLKLTVLPFSNVDLDLLAANLTSRDIDVQHIDYTFRFIEVIVQEEEMPHLAATPGVQGIDWVYPEGEAENYTSISGTRTNYLDGSNSNGLDFDGTGVSVMIQDNGSVGEHLDYHGRIPAQFTNDNEGDHGDHVTGTVGGAGNLNPYHRGQASGADMYIYKAAPQYNGIASLDSHYYSYNIFITSTSYSDGCNAGYTSRTRLVDEQVYELPSLMHVYSAGNAGTSNCGYGAGSYWGNITGGHKMGKNVIAVANLTETDLVSGSSSRGPAYDGRIKPDISAKGTNVTSTIDGNTYDTYSGTSMACPNVAGAMAVLYQAYESHFGGPPAGGLMKAIMLNTADDIGNTGPDFIHGWGRVNVRKAYDLIADGLIFEDSVANGGGANIHQITVPAGARNLKVMLYWTDPEASVNASTALVNDLDLLVFDPSLDTLYPYVLNATPDPVLLNTPAGTGQDHINNVEQVEVSNPAQGNHLLVVNPYMVPDGPQTYYLVYTFDVDPIVITYPVGGESVAPFTAELIRWDAHIEGTLDIDYSSDGGSSWSSISSGVNAAQGYFQWTVPFMMDGDVVVRLTHDSATVSSEAFSIMPSPSGINVGWACPDSIGLIWDPMAGALSFDIYKLGSKYMDSIGTSTINEFVDYNSNPYSSNLWYSVSSDGPDGASSKRAIAVQKAPGLVNCFLANDLHAVSLLPEINTLYPCHSDDFKFGFVVENAGVVPVSGFDATIYLQGSPVITESFVTNLPPLESDTYYFSSTSQIDSGLHDYLLVLELTGDPNPYNDSLNRVYNKSSLAAISPLSIENFDAYPLCGTDPDCGATVCTFEGDWTNEANGLFDDIDWRVMQGTTPTTFTGPLGDNSSNGMGNFIYLETSGDCIERTANLISKCVDLSLAQNPHLSFYYNMYGVDMGELHVDVYDGEHWNLDVTSPIVGNQGSTWLHSEVDLSSFNGKSVVIRFRGITGPGFRSDMALDDISITHPPVANFEAMPQTGSQDVIFTDLSVYADSMSFDVGDGTALFDTVPGQHSYSQVMAYTVTQIVSNDFGMDTMEVEILNLGMGDAREMGPDIYPNPARDYLNITLGNTESDVLIELWTIDARMVLSTKSGQESNVKIDVSSLAPGTYFLRMGGDSFTDVPVLILP